MRFLPLFLYSDPLCSILFSLMSCSFPILCTTQWAQKSNVW